MISNRPIAFLCRVPTAATLLNCSPSPAHDLTSRGQATEVALTRIHQTRDGIELDIKGRPCGRP